MSSTGDNQMTEETSPSSGRQRWLVPVIVIGLVVLAVVGIVAVVASDTDDDDDLTAVVVDMSVDEIRQLQTDLTALDYYDGPINGIYNQKTVDAVKALQADLGVTVDGIIGPETLAAIERQLGSAPSTSAPATSPPTTSPPSSTGPTVELTIDGSPTEVFQVTRCDNPGETTLTLEAQTNDLEDPTQLSLSAEGGTGTIQLTGATEAEGTVDQVMVGDTGSISASGELTLSDDAGGGPASFDLRGQCA